MPHPTGLAYGFAFVMVAVSLYCLGWLIVATRQNRHNHVDVNVAHVAMGWAMAGQLVPRYNVVPDGVWEAVFVVIALWFSWQGVRFVVRGVGGPDDGVSHGLSHYLIHLVMALAMLYMYLAVVPGPAGAGPDMAMTGPRGSAANFVGLPLVFVVILLASAVWQLDGQSRYSNAGRTLVSAGVGAGMEPNPPPAPALAPRLEMGCHIAMSITMGYMLILTL